MGQCIIHGQLTKGGIALNVAYGAELPTAVVEGQVFIVTTTVPGIVYLDTDEPKNPTKADVWIEVGASAVGVDLSKTIRNGLTKIRQYNGNSWGSVAGYLGASNEWKKLSAALPPVGIALNDCTWEQLSDISAAGSANAYFNVGDTKTVTIGSVTYTVEIIGFNHDTLSNGGKAGITFGLVNCLNDYSQMNASATNSGGWGECELRSKLNNTIFTTMPADLQSVMKSVIKKTSKGSQASTIISTHDKLFLFSEIEVFGTTTHSFAGEGSQYSRFTTASTRIRKVKTTASSWWERSPRKDNNTSFCYVSNSGAAGVNSANGNSGAAFGFCV